MSPPSPMDDALQYMLWCDLHECPKCYGTGEISGDFDGEETDCPECGGSGIGPSADEEECR